MKKILSQNRFFLNRVYRNSEFRILKGEVSPCLDMHPKKVTVKKVTGVKLVTLFILILAVTQHIH